jgi:hypothetical protein
VTTLTQTGDIMAAIGAAYLAGITAYTTAAVAQFTLVPIMEYAYAASPQLTTSASVMQSGVSSYRSSQNGDVAGALFAAAQVAGSFVHVASQAYGNTAFADQAADRSAGGAVEAGEAIQGGDSYIASRPLSGDSKMVSHNFIVTDAAYPGDPNANIYSFGNNPEGDLPPK